MTSWFWAVTWTCRLAASLDRMVRPVMPEPEAPRLGAGRPADDLVAEADAEERAGRRR